jgi:hypothetical protein
MKPLDISNALRRIASKIDASKRPSRKLVLMDLTKLVRMAASDPEYKVAREFIEKLLPQAHGNEIEVTGGSDEFESVLSVLIKLKKENTFGPELGESIDYIQSAVDQLYHGMPQGSKRDRVLLINPKEKLGTILKILKTPKKGLFG